MYSIRVDGKIIGFCDKPRYVKIKESSGDYVQCERSEAIGLVFKGEQFNLPDMDTFEGRPTAVVTERDGAEIVFNQGVSIEENEAGIIDVEGAICELDSTYDTRISDLEYALCEFDMSMNN